MPMNILHYNFINLGTMTSPFLSSHKACPCLTDPANIDGKEEKYCPCNALSFFIKNFTSNQMKE